MISGRHLPSAAITDLFDAAVIYFRQPPCRAARRRRRRLRASAFAAAIADSRYCFERYAADDCFSPAIFGVFLILQAAAAPLDFRPEILLI